MLTGQTIRIVLSYVMHSHRPRFTFSATAEIWSFSIWTFLRTIGEYLSTQIDQIAVGGVSGSTAMGRYSVASDVASSPSREINEPMVAVIFPVMSRFQDDRQALRDVFMHTLAWSAAICISASVGVALVATDMANLILGHKWADIGPLMAWLSLGAGIGGLSSGAYGLFDALGVPQIGARLIWIRVAIFAAVVAPVAILTHSLIDIAIVRLIAFVLFLPGLYYAIGRWVDVSTRDYVRCLWRPLAASAVMAAAVLGFNALVALPDNGRLFIDVVLGGLVYFIASTWFWVLSGRPKSPEGDVISKLRRVIPSAILGLISVN
jgi:O-antigen/teichoic acid export membrane protein